MPRSRASRRAAGPTSMPLRRPCASGQRAHRAASAILGPDASKTTLTRVAETLRTAATAAEGRELLARGRLSEELSDWLGDRRGLRPVATREAEARRQAGRRAG